MIGKALRIGALITATLLPASLFAEPTKPISLIEALKEAEANSPKLKQARLSVEASAQQIRAAQAGYFPTLDAAASAMDGNSGSFSMLGVGANFSSSARIGEGAALILKQNIWDFGRTSSSIETARANYVLSKNEISLLKAQTSIEVLHTFLECSYLKEEARDAVFSAHEARLIAREMEKYVRSGQRSIVERYLVDAQAQEMDTLAAEIEVRRKSTNDLLGIELGQNMPVECMDLYDRQDDLTRLLATAGRNPLLEISGAQAQIAQHRLDQAKAEYKPYLIGMVDGGYFDNSALKDRWNYAAGISLGIPIFEGFRTQAQVDRYAAESQAQEANIEFSQQRVEMLNSKYGEEIQANRVKLESLQKESDLAKNAYLLAKKRFFNLQGTMVDLREALRNLDRIRLEIDRTERDYLISQGERALFNGAHP